MGGRGSSMRSSSGYASINDDIADELRTAAYGVSDPEHAMDIVEDALDEYTGMDAMDLNAMLRNDEALVGRYARTVSEMDAAMRPLGQDILLTRNVSERYLQDTLGLDTSVYRFDAWNAQVAGKTFTAKEYLSTSWDRSAQAYSDRRVVMNIHASKSTRGIITTNYSESEIVLARNTRYRVDRIHSGDNGKVVVEVYTR